MLLALGTIWFVTDTAWFRRYAFAPAAGSCDPGESATVSDVLRKVDLTGALFFAGVLLAVGALDTAGALVYYAECLAKLCGNNRLLMCSLLGISSAIVDNVSLVQVAIRMFRASAPAGDPLWQLVTLAVGAGGSIVSIGSVAGVMLMTMEGVGYVWYCRKVSLWAVAGLALCIGVYEAERFVFG